MNRFSSFRLALTVCVFFVTTGRAADAPADDRAIHDKLSKEYLAGKWDDLEADLKSNAQQIKELSGEQKSDVAYMKDTLAECHPAWWKTCKAGKKGPVRANMFGQNVMATYDPAQKVNLQFNFRGSDRQFTVYWPADDMDNPANAEHGFTKGELNNLTVWSTLSSVAFYVTLPITAMTQRTETQKTLQIRTIDFRGTLAGVYYGNPRSRQWALFLGLHAWEKKYAKMPTVMSRKAIGAMFMAEVIGNPGKYPSIKVPKVEADNAEEKLALTLQKDIEKHGFTFAEDKSLRDAAKAFAAANDGLLKNDGMVKLSSGLQLSLDPEKDASFREKRDEWIGEQGK